MCDSFDTPRAINELSTLVIATNAYLMQGDDMIKVPLLRTVSRYVFKILKAFGIYEEDDMPAEKGQDTITPLMNALAKYRDQVKENAKEGPKALFEISDKLRDDILPFMGIALEDRKPGEPSVWNLAEAEELLRERQKKIDAKNKKEEEKRAREALALKKVSNPHHLANFM